MDPWEKKIILLIHSILYHLMDKKQQSPRERKYELYSSATTLR